MAADVNIHKILKENHLTPEQHKEALKRYPTYKEAVERTKQVARAFSEEAVSINEPTYGCNPDVSSHPINERYEPNYEERVEQLKRTGEILTQSQLNEKAHAASIKAALVKNKNMFPVTYIPQVSRKWCFIL